MSVIETLTEMLNKKKFLIGQWEKERRQNLDEVAKCSQEIHKLNCDIDEITRAIQKLETTT